MRTIEPVDTQAVMAFLAVAEHQSFRGAAKSLRMPRSTVSQRVAALEEQLGVQLFSRNTRTVRLTDLGTRYQREVLPAVQQLQAASVMVHQAQEEPSGSLRITTPYEFGLQVMGPVLVAYAKRFPLVKLDVDFTDRRVNVIDEGFDLAVRAGPFEDSNLSVKLLGKSQHIRLYASPQYLKAMGTPKRPADLTQHRCLAMSGMRNATTWRFMEGRRLTHLQVVPALRVNSPTVLVELAIAGLGIARTSSRMAQSAVASGALKEVLPTFGTPEIRVGALTPEKKMRPAVREMIDLITQQLAVVWP